MSEQKEKVFFQIELTDSGIERKMVLENVDPNRAVGILVQASESIAKEIMQRAELQTKTSEKGNN
jgi:hypothetical protein